MNTDARDSGRLKVICARRRDWRYPALTHDDQFSVERHLFAADESLMRLHSPASYLIEDDESLKKWKRGHVDNG